MRHQRFAILFAVVALAGTLVAMRSQAKPRTALFMPSISSRAVSAQCPSQPVLASGLRAPVKLVFTQHGNLLVAEAGGGQNDGRVSIVDPATGHRRTLLDGLPSGFMQWGGNPSGPSGLPFAGARST